MTALAAAREADHFVDVTNMVDADPGTLAYMTEVMRVAIKAARAVGKPDPSDDDLYLALTRAGVHAVDILRHFTGAKAKATEAR
jgi:hypothetical protein